MSGKSSKKENGNPGLADRLGYCAVKGATKALSLLPLRMLYGASDVLAFLAHRVVRYRLKVVRSNLESSFPDMPKKELRRVERKFYRFLGDYMMETVKLLSMSGAEMKRRLRVVNPEVVDRAMDRGRNVILYLGHFCNWEWVSSLPVYFDEGRTCAQVYHRLHNHPMDRLFMEIRTRFGSNNIAMDEIMRRLIEWKREGTPTVTGLISDQAPHWEIHLFLDFLNHDTAVFTGPERISRFLDAEVYYCHMSRPRRGEYELRFDLITDRPKGEETFAVTREYFRRLEENIKEQPELWLWSHKRWKRTRADFMKKWGDKAEGMLEHL